MSTQRSESLLSDAASPNSTQVIEIQHVADKLESALKHFTIDARLIDMAEHDVPDARHRLQHVLKLTDEAAHRGHGSD